MYFGILLLMFTINVYHEAISLDRVAYVILHDEFMMERSPTSNLLQNTDCMEHNLGHTDTSYLSCIQGYGY